MSEQIASIYTFTFVVHAKNWDEVVNVLKDELGITKKHDASDRKINGLYLASCLLKEEDITKDFYQKTANSDCLAIHSDGKSFSLYPKILIETRTVEERLRWLLLHVSDAIEDYAQILGYDKNKTIEGGKLDPITSRLSFEEIISLLETDQSWLRDGVSDSKMRELINQSNDFDSFKKSYLEKTAPKTIWESISELVLDKPVKWEIISPKLKSIKALRNKCAHFHTVTDGDLSQAQHLKIQIMKNLTKKKTYTSSDLMAFTNLGMQMAETIKSIQKSYYENIIKLTDASFSTQQALAQLSGTVTSLALTDVAKSVTKTVNQMYSPIFRRDYYKIASRMSEPTDKSINGKDKDAK